MTKMGAMLLPRSSREKHVGTEYIIGSCISRPANYPPSISIR